MILTTEQQANNFAIYALETDPRLAYTGGLNEEALIAELMHQIRMVFGGYTFTTEQLEHIAQVAVNFYDEVA